MNALQPSVCTLFEKDYHHGVVSLVNSLVRNGFEGAVYAGYRGELPAWARAGARLDSAVWHGATVVQAGSTCEVLLLPMQTEAHFTNIKPDFMLRLFDTPGFAPEGLFYLDPDICLAEGWSFMRDWVSCGVALCEDANSPLESGHPRRIGWRRFFDSAQSVLEFRTVAYVNGGCIGVAREHRRFLECWKELSAQMGDFIGGLGASQLEGGKTLRNLGFADCFDRSDQDALNAAIEASREPVSILPQSAMGFKHGPLVLPHAIGRHKPWRRKYLVDALRGIAPAMVDRIFWQSAPGPLRSMSNARIRRALAEIAFASALGRFYRRA